MVKRTFDLFLAIVTSLLFAPLILVIALLIRFKIGRPVLFKQFRPSLLALSAYSTQSGHPFQRKVDSRSVATRGF